MSSDGTVVAFSELLRVEFLHALRLIANDPTLLSGSTRRQHRLQHWAAAETIREAWLRHGLMLLDAFLAGFTAAYAVPIDDEIFERSVALMARFQLKSYDAVHVATAMESGIPAVITIDEDFGRITDIVVVVVRDGS